VIALPREYLHGTSMAQCDDYDGSAHLGTSETTGLSRAMTGDKLEVPHLGRYVWQSKQEAYDMEEDCK
jgi:hypothetical protein